MNPEKIEHLIEQSKKRDAAAFRQLVETFQPLVFRLAFRLLCNDDEAKDIVQESFIRIWLHLHQFKHGTKFSTWLYKIACNLCYDRLRAIKRLQDYSTTKFDWSRFDVASDQDMEQSLINRNLAEWILASNYFQPKLRISH
jgi:RNA polymerase sigma-70 factor (ECF subfamily)